MKKIVLGIIMICSIFMLGGCFKKTVITTSEFKTIAENKGYTIHDVMSQYSAYEYIKEATVARKDDKYQVEFYVLETEDDAKNMYETNKTTFEARTSGTSSKTNVNMLNYSSFTLNTNGEYYHLCRVENTFLYLHVDEQYKDQVKEIIDELGY